MAGLQAEEARRSLTGSSNRSAKRSLLATATGSKPFSPQLLPRLITNHLREGTGKFMMPWWVAVLPPGWFAGLDDAVAGSHTRTSWLLGSGGLAATALVVGLALGKLSKTYETGLQALNDTPIQSPNQVRQFRMLGWLVNRTPVSALLGNSVSRASFVLTAAYVCRDREAKLRVIPSLVPILTMPVAMMFAMPSHIHHVSATAHALATPEFDFEAFFGSLAICFAGSFLGSAPLNSINLLSFSQQWKASEVFMIAPIPGPWPIQKGAMLAVNVLLVAPMTVLLVALAVYERQGSSLVLVLPGLFLVPVYGRIPALITGAVPLSRASEEARAVGRGCYVMAAPLLGLVVSGIALGCRFAGWLTYMLIAEALIVFGFCYLADRRLESTKWRILD